MAVTMRRWHFRTVQLGDTYLDLPLKTKESEVRQQLDKDHRPGYWSSLRKGQKVEKK